MPRLNQRETTEIIRLGRKLAGKELEDHLGPLADAFARWRCGEETTEHLIERMEQFIIDHQAVISEKYSIHNPQLHLLIAGKIKQGLMTLDEVGDPDLRARIERIATFF